MQQLHRRNRNGQVLVLVALSLLVLLGIVALAVDGGHLYAERRKMQNAADAGALAGARVLCYEADQTPPYDDVVDEAKKYAVDHNGAEGAQVTVSGSLTVTVVATETATTFFARVIGFPTADVAARASAMCQGPEGAGGLWPLAVRHEVYTDTESIPCGSLFYAFVGTNDNEKKEIAKIDPAFCDLGAATIDQDLPTCDVDGVPVGLPGVDEVQHVGPGDMGWLDLFKPDDPYVNDCKAPQNCGSPNVACWIVNGHPGPVYVGDCLHGESGLNASLKPDVEGESCEIHNLILFDRLCDQPGDPDPLGDCPGSPYRVSGFGCMRVIGWRTMDFPEVGNTGKYCAQNVKTVIVQKMCEYDQHGDPMPGYHESCLTVAGEGSGQPSSTDDVMIIQLTE